MAYRYNPFTRKLDYYEAGAAAGANTALSNLVAVAINTSLISDTDSTDNLGSSTIAWANEYVDDIYFVAPSTYRLSGTSSAGRLRFLRQGTNIAGTYEFYGTSIVYGLQIEVGYLPDYSGGKTLFNSMGHLRMDFRGDVRPLTDSTYNLGNSAAYWLETYTDKLFLNATATLDGATAGDIKATGTLRFGAHTAIGAETTTGYITIKDSAGSVRKLAVVS